MIYGELIYFELYGTDEEKTLGWRIFKCIFFLILKYYGLILVIKTKNLWRK